MADALIAVAGLVPTLAHLLMAVAMGLSAAAVFAGDGDE
jgi:hypothetical protein